MNQESPVETAVAGDQMTFWQRLKRRKPWKYPFVDTRFQFNVAFLLALLGAANLLFFGVLFYSYAQTTFEALIPLIPDYAVDDGLIGRLSTEFYLTLIFGGAFEIILLVLLGLFVSHRVAGPLFNMTQKIKHIARGGIPATVRLRQDDFLNRFADTLNEAILHLTSRREKIRNALDRLKNGQKEDCEKILSELIIEPAPEPEPSSTESSQPEDQP